MNGEIIFSLLSVLAVSLISFIGLVTFSLKEKTLLKILLYLVSFSAGALLGDVFAHLLPELVEKGGIGIFVSVSILLGIVVSFGIEKFIHWRHHHIQTREHIHPFAYMNLIGDGVHNFIDGLIIAASYIVSLPLGLATTFAVVFHEIAQEIGDFGVLVHGGFTIKKALFFNFLTAITAFAGVFMAFLFSAFIGNFSILLIAFASGTFIYIASSDLIPELHKETGVARSLGQLIALILGIAVMFVLLYLG